MAIKLIMTDLDGTLFKDDHETISKRNVKALKKAQEHGIKICISTGRTKSLVEEAEKFVPFADFIITSNGAVTYDGQTGKVITSELLDAEKSKKVFEIINAHTLTHEIYFEGEAFLDSYSAKLYNYGNISAHYLKVLKDKANVVESLSEHIGTRGVEKINIMRVVGNELMEVKNAIEELGDIFVTSSIPENLEMNNFNANKGYALKKLCEILGIAPDEVMAFGDTGNDCEMLKIAGLSFAMENGWDEAKKVAKAVAPSNEDDGVAVEIEKYLESNK